MKYLKNKIHNLTVHLYLHMPLLLVHRQVQGAWPGQLLELSFCKACQQSLPLAVQGKPWQKRRACLMMRLLTTMLPAASRPAPQLLLRQQSLM